MKPESPDPNTLIQSIPAPAPVQIPTPSTRTHFAVFAHLSANKLAISNTILYRARRIHGAAGGSDRAEFREYSFFQFQEALRVMAEGGYVVPVTDGDGKDVSFRRTFYLGEEGDVNAAAVGLVNVALFLSLALADSFEMGSCDEVNVDVTNGYLPVSNSCGQYGMSYQDMHCDAADSSMECPLDIGMQVNAEANAMGVSPLYCGSTSVYPFTGAANHGVEMMDSPVQNREGRTDVEGCW